MSARRGLFVGLFAFLTALLGDGSWTWLDMESEKYLGTFLSDP